MRIIRFLDEHAHTRYGIPLEAHAAEGLEGSVLTQPRPTGVRHAVARLLSPVEPRAILCIGLNYKQHAAEMGSPLPQHPVLFMKNPAAVNHPDSPIVIPPICENQTQVDFECELAVVIGRDAREVSKEEALRYVAGYTIGNDVSARWWQKQGGGGQWVRGKSFDTFCPLGPVLVTPDELGDPQSLELSTRLNGQVMQQTRTSDMIFPVATLISELSRGMTLLAGTVLLTGTPSGVGMARNPPVYLQDGDTLELTISGIGTLRNTVRKHA